MNVIKYIELKITDLITVNIHELLYIFFRKKDKNVKVNIGQK